MSKYAKLFQPGLSAKPDANNAPTAAETDSERYTILLVDDEASVLKALIRIFIDENYHILTANSGSEALEVLDQHSIQLIISDHRMPGITGAELLREIKKRWPETIRIMLTGYADVQSVMGAVKDGAVYKFITKPWNDDDLRLTVSLALQQYDLLRENRALKQLSAAQQKKIGSSTQVFSHDNSALGSILTTAKLISRDDLAWAKKEQAAHEFLGDTLVRLNITSEAKIVSTLQTRLNIDTIDLKENRILAGVSHFLPLDFCKKNHLIPVKLQGQTLTLAMADPTDLTKCDNLSLITGLKIQPLLAPNSEILKVINHRFSDNQGLTENELQEFLDLEPIDEIDVVIDEEDNTQVSDLISQSDVPPIVRIVNSIISEAIRYGASDIHIEPKSKHTAVRYRIDGILQNKIKIPADLHAATVSRIKILAKIDISERRRPQDGRVTIKLGTRIVDMRVSTMPVVLGEKIVMRILDKGAAVKQLSELGVCDQDMQRVLKLTHRPQGVVIATGPTGSGKTTLLYSLLSTMMTPTKNFETIEEPVEYFLEEANQVSIHGKIGLTFAQVLRATLRQDPDVILVGEIRDLETADVSFKAALTGHMVLSTLHTNSAISSITRLIDIGIKPYIIASALEALVAQRLVRRLCPYCRTKSPADPEQLRLLGVDSEQIAQMFTATGCDKCDDSGYKGRVGIFELFVMNDEFRHFISTDYKEATLLEMAVAGGMRTLLEDGIEKVVHGETSIEELLRVLGPQLRYERTCSNCQRIVAAKYRFCPYCGHGKKPTCPKCQATIEADWLYCPSCSAILSDI
jgi:type II secretory ATPase GspE/PulE/Tfp pilus assembly ATPase PilB-like protein/FixJ family two-component response regulator/RNA polymerase subunit RPABC4/transcription elongation factor Spt4